MTKASATVLRLPPHSPEDSPSEGCWRNGKTLLRGTAACSKEALDEGMTAAWPAVMPSEAQGWLTLCGYQTPSYAKRVTAVHLPL